MTPNPNPNTLRNNRNPRPQLDWEFEIDFSQGPLTARVTVIKFAVPEYSTVVGTPRPDGSIRPYVRYRAATPEQLDLLEQYNSCYAIACDQAHKYIMDKLRAFFAEREAAQLAAEEQRRKDEANARTQAQAAKERAERKKKNWENNHEKRRVENRQRAGGGSGGGKKKG